MLHDVVEARALGDYRLFLRFDDGRSGVVDLGKSLKFTGVFAPLRDPKEFAKVFVHPEFHTVTWPNEVDLDTEVLYSEATGTPLPAWSSPAAEKPARRSAKAKPKPRAHSAAAKRKPPPRRTRAR